MSGVDSATRSEMSGWRRRRRVRAGVAAGGVVAVLAVCAVATVGFGGGAPAAPEPRSQAATTVPVTRETLVDYVTVDGDVGYGPTAPMASKAAGTVTWLAPVGSTVRRGQSLLRVNDQPVVLLYGSLPMYRPLAEPATGNDVEQFEANLRALGYPGFTPDQAYTQATTVAVKGWQRDLGLPETGSVAVGQVAYAPGPLRIAGHLVRVGGAVPADVLTYSSTTKVVAAAVDAGKSGWAAPGVKVTVGLPDGRSVAGRVDTVGAEATPEGSADGGTGAGQASGSATGAGQASGSATVSVTVRVADQNALRSVGRGTVEVRYASRERKNVLTVPVGALLALAEGGYGLEVVGGGSSRIVAVRTGMFAGGRVEVSGTDIRAGTTVRMPQ